MAERDDNPYGFDYDPNWRTGPAQGLPDEPSAASAPSARVDPGYRPPTATPAADISSRYGIDYQADWRQQQMAPTDDDYGWGISAAFMRGLTRLRALPDVAQGDYEELAEHFGELQQYQLNERDQQRMAELEQTDGFWSAVGYYLRNPTLAGQVVAESLPMMLAPIVGAVGGGITGGAVTGGNPIGAGAGMIGGGALGSYATEYYNSVGEFFQKQGIDMTNPQQLQAAFNNPELMSAAREYARARGIPIAIFDGLSMGLAGRVYKPVSGLVGGARGTGVRGFVGRTAGATTEMGLQAGFGAAGEAGAQISAEGEITSWPEVAAEAIGEIVPGVVEAGVSSYVRRRALAKRQGIEDPDASPLAALDVADERDQTIDIPETDIDPLTGQVVTRTGDPVRDELDIGIEEAMLDLELSAAEAALMDDLEAQAATEAAEEAVGFVEQRIFEEREAAEAAQRQAEEDAARQQQVDQIVAQDEAAAAPEPGQMVTPRGVPVEQQPIDIIGGQEAEGMRTTGPEEALYETGGRPAGTPMADAMREAGIGRAQRPPEPPDGRPPPPGGAAPVQPVPPAGQEPVPDLRDTRAAEALEAQAEAAEEARIEREAIQAESAMPATEAAVEPEIPGFEPTPEAPRMAPEPAVEYADERLAQMDYQEGLDRLVSETQAGGGITLIPSEELGVSFKGRTPSQNPAWMQSIIDAEKIGRPQVMAAVEKAKAGKRLGPRQKRIVQAMLDELDAPSEYEGMQYAEPEVDADGQVDVFGGRAELEPAAAPTEQPDADIGVPGDIFSEAANRQTDLVEAARQAEPQFVPRATSQAELETLATEVDAQIDRFKEVGEQNMGFDQSEIVGGIQKLALHGHPRADELRAKMMDEGRLTDQEAGELENLEAQEYIDELRASGTAADSLVADIEAQHEAWRQSIGDTGWTTTTQDEIDANNTRINRLAELGDNRAGRLVQDMDHWLYEPRIQVSSNHPRFVQSRKQKKIGGVTDVRDREQISVDIAQLSWTVPYSSLTFATPEDQARMDRILDVMEAAAEPPPPTTPEDGSPEANVHVDENSNVTFAIDEQQFNEVINDFEQVMAPFSKSGRRAIDTKLKGTKFIPLRRAQERVNEWRDHAIRQNQTNPENHRKIVLSLFDETGNWARPWAEAGYQVYTFDIKTGQDAMDFSVQYFVDEWGAFGGDDVYAILAACPCTTFSNSGTRWRKSRHDAKSKEAVAEMWGDRAVEQGFEIPNEYGKELVAQTLRTIEFFRPKIWALENPEGRIETETGLTNWRTGFQPHNFGDPYTKRTLLWGNFNPDMPTANVKPTEGSKMHKMSPSEERAALRSETPEGFSYAFFMANNFADMEPVERTALDYPEAAGAVRQAFEAGVTEERVREILDLGSYANYEYEAARAELRAEIEQTVPSEAAIDAAAAEADPDAATDAQKKAGNYKKGHMKIAGLDITIENPTGTVRYGKQKLRDHYGYIKRTEGADGDNVDVFVNSKAQEDWTGDVYIVDQLFPEVGGFDEHKVMFGYNNMIDARRAYKRNFQKDWKGEGAVTKMTLDEFKSWLAEPGANRRPAAMSKVTEAGKKARAKQNKDLRYSVGKDELSMPSIDFVKKVLEGGERKMGDIPDTMPMNMAVSELLRLQAQREGAPAAPARPTFGEIEAAIKPVEDSLPGAPVTLLRNYKQTPGVVARTMEAQGMTQVKAVFDPQSGQIYVFADQIESIDEATRTALHEKAHRGLRVAFGNRLDPLLDDIFLNVSERRQADMQKIVDAYGLDVGVVQDRRVIAEELLAHMAEHSVNDGIVNRAVAFIRNLLRQMGFVEAYTDNDIRAIIREAQGAISRGPSRLEGVTIEEEVVLDETGEVFIVEQDADVALTGISQRIEICKKVRRCL